MKKIIFAHGLRVSEIWPLIRWAITWLVPWLSGRTLVFDRRAFAVLCSTYNWRVTTCVGKPSAIGQPTRPTQPFILSGSMMSSKLQLDVVTTVRGVAIWWTWTKAKGRHGVVCRLNCVIHVWAPWGRDICHLGRYVNPRAHVHCDVVYRHVRLADNQQRELPQQ